MVDLGAGSTPDLECGILVESGTKNSYTHTHRHSGDAIDAAHELAKPSASLRSPCFCNTWASCLICQGQVPSLGWLSGRPSSSSSRSPTI